MPAINAQTNLFCRDKTMPIGFVLLVTMIVLHYQYGVIIIENQRIVIYKLLYPAV